MIQVLNREQEKTLVKQLLEQTKQGMKWEYVEGDGSYESDIDVWAQDVVSRKPLRIRSEFLGRIPDTSIDVRLIPEKWTESSAPVDSVSIELDVELEIDTEEGDEFESSSIEVAATDGYDDDESVPSSMVRKENIALYRAAVKATYMSDIQATVDGFKKERQSAAERAQAIEQARQRAKEQAEEELGAYLSSLSL